MDTISKLFLTMDELPSYTGFAKSYLYKKSMQGLIPGANKPGGGKLFFDREKIDRWLLGDPEILAELKAIEEKKEVAAATYISTHAR